MKNKSLPNGVIKEYVIVTLLWLFFQAIWYASFGVHFELEATKYIREAAFILENYRLSESRYLFYFSTTAVIAFSNIIGAGLYGALLIIMAFNLFSYLYFFRALKTLFKDRLSAYTVVFLLLSFWPYQSWSLYLYTECFFYSAVVLLFSHLLLYRKLDSRFLLLSVLLLGLVVISRPLGILFVFPTLLFIFVKLSKKHKIYFSVAALFSLLLLNYVVQIVFTTTSDWGLHKTIKEADVICDIPGPTNGQPLDLSDHQNQLYQLFYYVTHNFTHFTKLALLRLKYFYTMVRSYYSVFHNVYLILYLVVMYTSILFGIKRILQFFSPALSLFIFSSIGLFSLATALQCDDYHNRFFLTLMPLFMTMTAVVILPLMYRFSLPKKEQLP